MQVDEEIAIWFQRNLDGLLVNNLAVTDAGIMNWWQTHIKFDIVEHKLVTGLETRQALPWQRNNSSFFTPFAIKASIDRYGGADIFMY